MTQSQKKPSFLPQKNDGKSHFLLLTHQSPQSNASQDPAEDTENGSVRTRDAEASEPTRDISGIYFQSLLPKAGCEAAEERELIHPVTGPLGHPVPPTMKILIKLVHRLSIRRP